MPNPTSARPLAKATIEELTRLHLSGGPRFSAAIRAELAHRKLSKTEQLRRAVGTSGQASPGPGPHEAGAMAVVFPCQSCDKNLRVKPPRASAVQWVAACPACGSSYRVDWGPVCRVRRVGARQEGNGNRTHGGQQEDLSWALSVLELPEGATHAEVDMTRRRLLQQLHPDKHGASPPRVQRLLEAEFKRVEKAYNIVSKAIRR